MFTTLSSHVGKITYAKVVDAALHIEVGQIERKASRDAIKKPKL